MRIQGSLPEIVRKTVERDVGRFCLDRVPPHIRDKIKIEHEIRSNSVTIFECRPPWREDFGPEWTKGKVAQLRYEDERWAIYSRDRNGHWHFYYLFEPTPDLSAALAEINFDPTGIFWG